MFEMIGKLFCFKVCTDKQTHKPRDQQKDSSFALPVIPVVLALACVPSTYGLQSIAWANLNLNHTIK